MTWKKIIDSNNLRAYLDKVENAKGVYILYSVDYPYLPIDIAYSVYEVSVKYSCPLDTVLTILHKKNKSLKYGFSLQWVKLTSDTFTLF